MIHRFPFRLSLLFEKYRRRFGIESSYQIEERARARTTARNALLRLLWVEVSLLLQNLWIWLQWAYVSLPRQGGREILQRQFTFLRMLLFLRRAIEAHYRVVEEVIIMLP